jgi:hypothetical protein
MLHLIYDAKQPTPIAGRLAAFVALRHLAGREFDAEPPRFRQTSSR